MIDVNTTTLRYELFPSRSLLHGLYNLSVLETMASRCLCEPGGGGDALGERCEAITASRGGGCGLLSRDGLALARRFAGLEWTTSRPRVEPEYTFFAENGDELL